MLAYSKQKFKKDSLNSLHCYCIIKIKQVDEKIKF
ncbi:hypothetical protein pb186bvf_003222 [Paramecium bursaria]